MKKLIFLSIVVIHSIACMEAPSVLKFVNKSGQAMKFRFETGKAGSLQFNIGAPEASALTVNQSLLSGGGFERMIAPDGEVSVINLGHREKVYFADKQFDPEGRHKGETCTIEVRAPFLGMVPFDFMCQEVKGAIAKPAEPIQVFDVTLGFSDKEIFERLSSQLKGIASPTPHQILGINPDASKAEIVKAYRKLALQWHPDKAPKNELTEKEMFEAITKKLNNAYEKLMK